MVEHEHRRRVEDRLGQRCDTPTPPDSTDTAGPAPLVIDRGRVQSCFIALPILLPFVFIMVLFSGDSPHGVFWWVTTLTTMFAGFFLGTYLFLTVLDWIGKHI